MITQRLPKPPQKPYIHPDKRGNKAMTIAFGYRCNDGVLLCSDRQMTTRALGTKYSEDKIHSIFSMGKQHWTVAITYAGDYSIMMSFMEKMNAVLLSPSAEIDLAFVRETIQQSLYEVHSNSPNIDTEYIDIICGVHVEHPQPTTRMYVGRRTTLHEEYGIAFVGAGDSSLSRFLASVLPFNEIDLDIKTALLIGSFIVEQTKEFVDGCGGETQAMAVTDEGLWEVLNLDKVFDSNEQSTAIAKSLHRCTADLYRALLDPDVEIRKLQDELEATKRQINEFYDLR